MRIEDISHNLAKDKVYSLYDIKPRLIRRMEMANPAYHFPKPKIPAAWVMQCPMMRAVAYPTSDDAEISVPADSRIGRCKVQILQILRCAACFFRANQKTRIRDRNLGNQTIQRTDQSPYSASGCSMRSEIVVYVEEALKRSSS